ncbi:unnamed protein product [Brassica rapa]|uniref:Uncharacterized protein n=1 Tax=Brassica campestris TaxID=3711 RepID=A0A8D9GX44_BRACM|nr:unnamed protein product [Brassica rapa]
MLLVTQVPTILLGWMYLMVPRTVCYTISCCGCELHTMATLIKI